MLGVGARRRLGLQTLIKRKRSCSPAQNSTAGASWPMHVKSRSHIQQGTVGECVPCLSRDACPPASLYCIGFSLTWAGNPPPPHAPTPPPPPPQHTRVPHFPSHFPSNPPAPFPLTHTPAAGGTAVAPWPAAASRRPTTPPAEQWGSGAAGQWVGGSQSSTGYGMCVHRHEAQAGASCRDGCPRPLSPTPSPQQLLLLPPTHATPAVHKHTTTRPIAHVYACNKPSIPLSITLSGNLHTYISLSRLSQ